jgi:hypothetical protein
VRFETFENALRDIFVAKASQTFLPVMGVRALSGKV